MIRFLKITLAVFFTTTSAYSAEYPPNIDYGNKGTFIAKRAVEYGRAANLTTLGPVLASIPEAPGSSHVGLQNGVQYHSTVWDLSNLTNPTLIVDLTSAANDGRTTNAMPVDAHGTVVRFQDGIDYLFLGASEYLTFDPSFSNAAEQVAVESETWNFGWGPDPLAYSTMTSPFHMRNYWEYGFDTSGLYSIRDPSQFLDTGGETEWLGRSENVPWLGTPLVSWDHLGLTGVTGFSFMMGELLVVASDQQSTGLAVYELSGYREGVKPRLLSRFQPVLTEPDGHQAGIGGYWVEPYGSKKVVYAARERRALNRHYPAMFVVDFTNPREPALTCEIYFDQEDSELNTRDGDYSSDPMYIFFQDQYAYVDHFQVDIHACEDAYEDGSISNAEFQEVVYKFEDLANGCDASQYFRPLGQVGVFGGYDFWVTPDTNEQGMCFFVTDDEPDTRAPYISGHRPLPGQTNFPVDGFIHLHIPETLRTETLAEAIRLIAIEEDGSESVVSFRHQLSHTGTISIWPVNRIDKGRGWLEDELTYLNPDTTYRVEVSGVQDFMGNTMTPYQFTFTTNDGGFPSNEPEIVQGPAPTYASEPYFPNHSGQITCPVEPVDASIYDPVWVVNQNNDSVSIIAQNTDELTFEKNLELIREIKLDYESPTSVTKVADFYAVTYRDDDKVVFFDGLGMPQFSVDTGHGTQPVSSVSNGDGILYVSLYGSGEVIKINSVSGQIAERLSVGPYPKAMAMRGDRILVTRFISETDYGEVYDIDVNSEEVDGRDMYLRRVIQVNKVLVPDDIDHGSGVPNYLSGIVIDRGGAHAYISATKANTDRGLTPRNEDANIASLVPLDDDNTVRPMIISLRLGETGDEEPAALPQFRVNIDSNIDPTSRDNTIDLDNSADPSAITYLPNPGIRVTAMQGNNMVIVEDLVANSRTQFNTGAAPQGMCSTLRTLYVKNFADRTVSAIDISHYLYSGRLNPRVDTISTVTEEVLNDEELRGLQVFYHSSKPQMGHEGYISCASCHNDGGHDGRTWDVAHLGEGMRNTMSLNGAKGVRFGNLHWSGNFDEVQDFELQIEQLNMGEGLVEGTTFREGDTPLSLRTTGLNSDLDALSAYVHSLGKSSVKHSPYRTYTGELTDSAMRGQIIFQSENCGSCHTGSAFRDGRMHDVGTITERSGNRLGSRISEIRTPTLIELWDSAPYFHDGSAQTLEAVFEVGTHQRELNSEQLQDLISFLLSIDREMFIDDDASFPE